MRLSYHAVLSCGMVGHGLQDVSGTARVWLQVVQLRHQSQQEVMVPLVIFTRLLQTYHELPEPVNPALFNHLDEAFVGVGL